MHDISSTREKTPSSEVFTVKRANDWSAGARLRPMPKMLFDEFWFEGELAILFGDTGKTSLAVQIGESIARGRPIGPMRMTAEPQTVLYLDLELTDKQWEMRYAAEYDDEGDGMLTGHYEFSDNFYRAEMSPASAATGIKAGKTLAEGFEPLLQQTGAKVLILDNITRLRRSSHSTIGEVLLINELNRLKREYGLSILVLVNEERRDSVRELTFRDMGPSKILGKFADTVFAIGQCGHQGPFRYLKHIRAHGTETIYDAFHAPSFRLTRLGGNFLGFEFDAFGAEINHLHRRCFPDDRETIDEIKRLSENGLSIRAIGRELELSKSKVQRMLQMWRPPHDYDPEEETEGENGWVPAWFPGTEEYDEALANPRFDGIYGREDDEANALRREANLIELAKCEARKEYVDNGVETTLAEMIARVSGGELAAVAGVAAGVEADDAGAGEASDEDDPEAPATYDPQLPSGPRLKRKLDGYDREILVESEDERGKHIVWYGRNRQGIWQRWERRPVGIIGEMVEDQAFLAEYVASVHKNEDQV